MCIAIMNKGGVTLKKKTLQNCWDNNGDGAGMLWTENGQLHVHKELNNFKAFYSTYQDIRKRNAKANIVLHFRIATHGEIDEANCHPFLVNSKLGFVHNGIIRGIGYDKEKSDTNLFCDLLRTLPQGWEYNSGIIKLIDALIGNGNKLLFLDSEDNYTIFNEDLGVWDMGCWFSNTTYKDYGYKDFGGTKVYKGSSAYVGKTYKPYDYTTKYWGSYEEDKWYNTPVKQEDDFLTLTTEQKKDYGYIADICDFCEKEKESIYHTDSMAYLCEDCTEDWRI